MDSVAVQVARRALQAVPLIAAAIVFNFVLIHLAPGDPATILAGESGAATAEYVEQLNQEFGLDQPLASQLATYAGKILRGDLGYSFRFREPVLRLIVDRLPATLLLMVTGILWAVLGGVALGVRGARKAGTWSGTLVSLVSLVGYATPVFWLGVMLVVVFGVKLQWLPIFGMATVAGESTGLAHALDVFRHLVLPAATLGLFYLALYARLTRASMLEVLGQDFVMVARAKGLSERGVIYRHALRNAVLGVVTVIGLQVSQLIGGSVVVETVFAWPGMGRLMFEAVLQRDYPVLLGVLLISTVVVIAGNLVVDIAYGWLDPRVRAS